MKTAGDLFSWFTGGSNVNLHQYSPVQGSCYHRSDDVRQTGARHTTKPSPAFRYLKLTGFRLAVTGSGKRTSFVGSDFFYEDVSGRNTQDDKHELASSSDKYYVLKNTPKDPKKVEFARYTTWIHKKTFLVIKNEYYDNKGKPYRRYQATAVKRIQGHWTVTKSRMTDLRTGRYTDIEYSDVKYDIGLDEDIFTERYLRRPPREHLRD